MSASLVNNLRNTLYNIPASHEYQRISFVRSNDSFVQVTIKSIKEPASGFEFEFDGCGIGDIGAATLSEVLKQDCNLRSLTIRNENITAVGAEDLGYGLRCNSRLQKLCLSGNTELGTDGVRTLFKNLDLMNTCLLEIDLSNVGITDFGCTVVANYMLCDKTCVRSINLSNNSLISVQGLENLQTALRAYPRLKRLDYMNEALKEVDPEVLNKRAQQINRLLQRNSAVMDTIDQLIDRVVSVPGAFVNKLTNGEPGAPKNTHIVVQRNTKPLVLSQYNILPNESTSKLNVEAFGFVGLRGNRKQMQDFILSKQAFRGREDEHVFAVFDGHGGVQCGRFIQANFISIFEEELSSMTERSVEDCLYQTFDRLNEWCNRFRIPHGTCAMVCYIKGNLVYSACVGDSQAVLARKDVNNVVSVNVLSELLTPKDSIERSRIEAQGGFVTNRGRVCGVLAVSRAIGDIDIPCVSSIPTITCTELVIDKSLQVIVIASDGVWGVHGALEVAQIATCVPNPYYAASMLCDSAFNNGSNDNISIICIKLIS